MSETRQPPRIPVEERLFSLVLALLASEAGLTKNEILSSVQGYRQRYRPGGDNANLERQFERDKDDIRDLGVPLETTDSPIDSGNNQNLRYRIPKGSYELPSDISFSAHETALLNLAAVVWREGALSGESRRAIIKLRGVGAGAAAPAPLLGYQPRLRIRDAAFEPLRDAIDRGLLVRFPYLKPGETAARERRVIPLAIVQYQGRWHLSAEDAATGVQKMFLLRRIVGAVIPGKAAPPRPGDQAAAALARLEEVWNAGVATVEVAADTDAARRLANRRGASEIAPGRLTLHFVDLAILADQLAAFGPEVTVVSPPELRDAVRDRLSRLMADHG